MFHRAGRVTASVCYQVSKTKPEKPSRSLINSIVQYNSQCDNKYTKHGRNMEPVAREYYKNIMVEHSNLVVCETGLHVRAICPFLGASPDWIVSCSCHAESLLEIKCPFKYRNSISGWEQDKDLPIDENKKMKQNHIHYYQIQLQIFVCNKKMCGFFIYISGAHEESFLITVPCNYGLLEKLLNDLKTKFMRAILPEIVSRGSEQNDCM